MFTDRMTLNQGRGSLSFHRLPFKLSCSQCSIHQHYPLVFHCHFLLISYWDFNAQQHTHSLSLSLSSCLTLTLSLSFSQWVAEERTPVPLGSTITFAKDTGKQGNSSLTELHREEWEAFFFLTECLWCELGVLIRTWVTVCVSILITMHLLCLKYCEGKCIIIILSCMGIQLTMEVYTVFLG